MKVLYVNYTDFTLESGSSVRPKKILDTMLELGYEVYSLSGEQMKKERKKNVRNAIKIVNSSNDFDFCYIESPTYPIMKHIDRKLIKCIKKKNIPMGYFYRDFYRMFPNEFHRRKNVVGRMKDIYLDILQYLTDRILRNCDIVYVPSQEAISLFDYKEIHPLPPAGENMLTNKEFNYTGIYVGGLSELYGGDLVLKLFNRLHNIDERYKLILVCRENEWDKLSSDLKTSKWLEVYHASGDDLIPLYKKASFAVSCKKDSDYNELAVSVKTFEYLSFGLPQVVTNSKATARLIESEKIGVAVNYSLDDFVEAVLTLSEDYSRYYINVCESLLERNLWEHRVLQIERDLLSVNKGR